jgi:hypothetical protein
MQPYANGSSSKKEPGRDRQVRQGNVPYLPLANAGLWPTAGARPIDFIGALPTASVYGQ